jgi:hypothetical protein
VDIRSERRAAFGEKTFLIGLVSFSGMLAN